MAIKIGINGYGKIGRNIHRISLKRPEIEVVAINSHADCESHAYLLRHDSVYGRIDNDIKSQGCDLIVDGKTVKVFENGDPTEIDWKKLGVDIVVESSGKYKKDLEANLKIIANGVKRVILSYPSTDVDMMIAFGINHHEINDTVQVISFSSCTTGALAPICKIVNDNLGIDLGFMTTVHAYTSDQRTLDGSHKKDPRRGRSVALNMVPTSTGAAKSIGVVIPELKGRLSGISVRVPTPTVSLIDLVVTVKKDTSAEEIQELFKKASKDSLKGILGYSEEPLVSTDIVADPRSVVIQGQELQVLEKRIVKILAWYDNEWGFSERLVDLIEYLSK